MNSLSLLLVGIVGCSDEPPSTTVPEASTPKPAPADDTGEASATTTTEVSTTPPPDPADCGLDTLEDHFTGLPPNPYGRWAEAPDCLVAPYDAIIVLGCPSEEDGTVSDCQWERAESALDVSEAGLGDRFIVSGAAVHNAHVEAEALREALLEFGVSDEAIWLEPKARHTDENLYWSTQIMQEQGWDSALVVSDPGHLVYTAVCDANCCVERGRLLTYAFDVRGGWLEAAPYILYPAADPAVSDGECRHLKNRFMCTQLDSRLACADDFQL